MKQTGLYRETLISTLLNQRNCKVGVEIGTFKAEFSRSILERWDGRLYMIDPWRPLGEDYEDSSNHAEHLNAYREASENLKGFEDRSFMLRGLSSQLVDLFEDNSLDWVYIDGNHAYDFVKQDLELWWPKLKKGGIMSGHDFLLIDWWASYLLPNGKDKYVHADGNRWSINKGPGEYADGYAGVFGVNPAVEEFCKEHEIKECFLSKEWNSSFVFLK